MNGWAVDRRVIVLADVFNAVAHARPEPSRMDIQVNFGRVSIEDRARESSLRTVPSPVTFRRASCRQCRSPSTSDTAVHLNKVCTMRVREFRGARYDCRTDTIVDMGDNGALTRLDV
jgi:hypothetical protein